MLKLAGSLCVMMAASGMAYTYSYGLRRGYLQMEQFMELLTVIESEILYSRCPLPELLAHLSMHLPQPYQGILAQCSQRMEDNKEADIPALWKRSCEEYRAAFHMPAEACQILLQAGNVFSYTSLDSSMQLLQASRKKLAAMMEKTQAESEGKKKLYCCLCYMAGFCTVIMLL